jgi:acetyl-CoA C-acetyltransferase
MGNVLQANQGQAPARQAALGAGLGTDVVCTTVNKVCASGLKATMLAASSILLGHQKLVVSGGFESMSNVPYYLPRGGFKYGHGELPDGIIKDGLWDVYNNFHMGNCGEDCAKKYKITREEQDQFAIESYKRAAEAYKNGAFKAEIVPVSVPQKKGDPIVVAEDEEYKKVQFDKISGLKPAFQKDGTITAANASKINDGAAALVLASGEAIKEFKLKPLARILSFADAENPPIEFTTAPAKAIPIALKRANLQTKDIDFWEINEAFSVVSLINNKLLNLDAKKVDVNGGAVALGHPIGASGARLLVTLLYTLQAKNARYGAAGICNGGGGASAMVIERLSL